MPLAARSGQHLLAAAWLKPWCPAEVPWLGPRPLLSSDTPEHILVLFSYLMTSQSPCSLASQELAWPINPHLRQDDIE